MMRLMEIVRPSDARVRAAAELRDRQARDRAGLTLVDGGREVLRALEAGAVVDSAFVCRSRLRTAEARLAVDRLTGSDVVVHECSVAAFEKVAYGDRDEGIVAIVRMPPVGLSDLRLPRIPLVVVTEDVEKPGNIGAILRSADGAGADAVVAADERTDLFHPNVIRASLGTVFRVPVARAASGDVRRWLEERGIRIVAAQVDAPTSYSDADLCGPIALVLGSEAAGLSDAWRGDSVTAVRLPMLGLSDSLNVSATAAVLLYEARRQRGMP